MINSRGIVQNNSGTYKFQKLTYGMGSMCKPISREEERSLIDSMMSEGKERELRDRLALHDIRMVCSIVRKYCQHTRDFDDRIARGMFGLTYAANTFNLYQQAMVPDRNDPMYKIDRKRCKKKPKFDRNGNPVYVKFITYATHWVFKRILEEFRGLVIQLDNNSISMNASAFTRLHEESGTTMENFLNDRISPEFEKTNEVSDGLTGEDTHRIYGKIFEYVSTTDELTAFEKTVIEGTFYRNKRVKDIAEEMSTDTHHVINGKKSALGKIRKYMVKELKIGNISDIFK